jgi:hypothetical protein
MRIQGLRMRSCKMGGGRSGCEERSCTFGRVPLLRRTCGFVQGKTYLSSRSQTTMMHSWRHDELRSLSGDSTDNFNG